MSEIQQNNLHFKLLDKDSSRIEHSSVNSTAFNDILHPSTPFCTHLLTRCWQSEIFTCLCRQNNGWGLFTRVIVMKRSIVTNSTKCYFVDTVMTNIRVLLYSNRSGWPEYALVRSWVTWYVNICKICKLMTNVVNRLNYWRWLGNMWGQMPVNI